MHGQQNVKIIKSVHINKYFEADLELNQLNFSFQWYVSYLLFKKEFLKIPEWAKTLISVLGRQVLPKLRTRQ